MLAAMSMSRNEGVVRYNIRTGNFIEQLAGKVEVRVFDAGVDDGIVGEDIGVVSEAEGGSGIVEGAAFGVEEGEVVGEVS